MGVPSFYRWLSKKYPKIVLDVVEEKSPEISPGVHAPVDTSKPNPNGFEIDNLYLDMNGIIHPCCHPEDGTSPTDEDEMIARIFLYIDRIFAMVRPRRVLYMAIDGVAPRAKMNQQRSRRFRSAKEVQDKEMAEEELRNEWEAKGLTPPPRKPKTWDSNVITPGTPFMAKLSRALHWYIFDRLSHDSGWRGVKVIFSDAKVPGEGEHKIMRYIRLQRSTPGHDPNQRDCIYGMDADLIMLGLATHNPHFCILRECITDFKGPPPQRCFLCGVVGHRADACSGVVEEESAKADALKKQNPPDAEPGLMDKPFQFLLLNVLREYLAHDLFVPNLPFAWNLEQCIDDFVFLCFFVGNDFLPHLPLLEIREDAIERLCAIYKRLLPSLGGYLSENSGELNLSRIDVLLSDLGLVEESIFKQRKGKEDFFKQRDANRNAQLSSRRAATMAQRESALAFAEQEGYSAVKGGLNTHNKAVQPHIKREMQRIADAKPVISGGDSKANAALAHAAKKRKKIEDDEQEPKVKTEGDEPAAASSSSAAAASTDDADVDKAARKKARKQRKLEAAAAAAAAAAKSADEDVDPDEDETNDPSYREGEDSKASKAGKKSKKHKKEKEKASRNDSSASASSSSSDEPSSDDEAESAKSKHSRKRRQKQKEIKALERAASKAAKLKSDHSVKDELAAEEQAVDNLAKSSSVAAAAALDKVAETLDFGAILNKKLRALERPGEAEEEDPNAPPKDPVRFGEDGWKERYYQCKMHIAREKKEDAVIFHKLFKSYAEGLCWVMKYYYQGCASWSWYYPFHYSPMASDLSNLDRYKIAFEMSKPFTPVGQLMGVLPALSSHALPDACRDLMTNPQSPIIDFYPADFALDLNGKKALWQAVALLPWIEENRLLTELKKVEPQFNAQERERDGLGVDYIFVHKSHPLANSIMALMLNYPADSLAGKTALQCSKLKRETVDMAESGGMSGFISPYVPAGELGGSLESEVGLGTLEDIQVLSCVYSDPPDRPHICALLPGLIPPRPVLEEGDLDESARGGSGNYGHQGNNSRNNLQRGSSRGGGNAGGNGGNGGGYGGGGGRGGSRGGFTTHGGQADSAVPRFGDAPSHFAQSAPGERIWSTAGNSAGSAAQGYQPGGRGGYNNTRGGFQGRGGYQGGAGGRGGYQGQGAGGYPQQQQQPQQPYQHGGYYQQQQQQSGYAPAAAAGGYGASNFPPPPPQQQQHYAPAPFSHSRAPPPSTTSNPQFAGLQARIAEAAAAQRAMQQQKQQGGYRY